MANNQISQKKKRKNKYVRIEICSLLSAPILSLKLPTCDANNFDNPSNKFHLISSRQKKEKSTACNQLQFKRKLTPSQLIRHFTNIRSAQKNPGPKNMPWETAIVF